MTEQPIPAKAIDEIMADKRIDYRAKNVIAHILGKHGVQAQTPKRQTNA
jgi:hypothetical protein